MTVKQLKKILNLYDENLEVQLYNNGFYENINHISKYNKIVLINYSFKKGE